MKYKINPTEEINRTFDNIRFAADNCYTPLIPYYVRPLFSGLMYFNFLLQVFYYSLWHLVSYRPVWSCPCSVYHIIIIIIIIIKVHPVTCREDKGGVEV